MATKKKTLVGRILASIANALSFFWKKSDEVLLKAIEIASQAVINAKLIDATHIGDIVAFLIPGTKDDELLAKLRAAIPKIVEAADLAGTFVNVKDPNEKLKIIFTLINKGTVDQKKMFYFGLARLFIEVVADGELTQSEIVRITDYVYEDILKKQAA